MARVYLVTNKESGKQYIGQTITEHSRHGHGHAIKKAYKKYGFSNFIYESIVSNISKDNLFLDYAEKFWINTLDTLAPNGYNLESGGKWGKITHHTPNLGMKASDATKQKMSDSQKKHWASLEVHPHIGKKASAETLEKKRLSALKRTHGDLTKQKISESIKQWHQIRKESLCQ